MIAADRNSPFLTCPACGRDLTRPHSDADCRICSEAEPAFVPAPRLPDLIVEDHATLEVLNDREPNDPELSLAADRLAAIRSRLQEIAALPPSATLARERYDLLYWEQVAIQRMNVLRKEDTSGTTIETPRIQAKSRNGNFLLRIPGMAALRDLLNDT